MRQRRSEAIRSRPIEAFGVPAAEGPTALSRRRGRTHTGVGAPGVHVRIRPRAEPPAAVNSRPIAGR